MITSRTKRQLVAFVIITLLGVAFVGARYAQLGSLFYKTAYDVNAHFAQSGGIFTGAEVTYRGVHIGKVTNMKLTRDGVDVVLAINNGFSKIPADTTAAVDNKSAVGEQYVELDPRTDKSPYLKDGSSIATADTSTPVSTTTLLTNLDNLVNSVPQNQLRTVVSELGAAFHGTGPSLSQIIDTSTSFIQTANANFATTKALIQDSSTVLQTQVDKASAIREFSRDLALFSGTLAGHDASLRKLIDNGSATANELRTFLAQNEVNLGRLIANLVTTGRITVAHLNGIHQILVLYPYVVAGGFTVAAPGPTGYDAHFGLILQQNPPVCHKGYHPSQFREPNDRSDKPMDTTAHCAEPPSQSNARGSQNAPNAGSDYRPPVATYDRHGGLTWADQVKGPKVVANGDQSALFGKDSWKWMLLQPAMPTQEQ